MVSNLAEIVEANASKNGDQLAFKCGSKSLSYTEMLTKTNQLAIYLGSLGVKKGDRVGIYLERSLETALSIYGILKAGAVFVPLDPSAPQKRTLHLIHDCNLKHLITSRLQRKKLVKLLEKQHLLEFVIGIKVDNEITSVNWDEIYKISTEKSIFPEIMPDDLAYVMYTSGSTGVPKGIMHTHKSGLSYARLSTELYKVSNADVFANHAPLHFDISTFGYLTIPFAGATTVIIQDAQIVFPTSIVNLLAKEKISIWYSVPLALIQLLQQGKLESNKLPDLRWVLFGGEVFTTKYLKKLVCLWPQTTFSNVYGPAEVNQCSYFNFNASKAIQVPLPLGAIWNETAYLILDDNYKNVLAGEVGQLLIHSTTMMQGYWNNTTLTARSFYTDPKTQKTYFKTGDMVKEDHQGILFFLGRNDFQIKIRGYRVEVSEVESVIANHPEVQEAAVFKIKKEDTTEELAVAILARKDSQLIVNEVLSFCKSNLPKYAVPQHLYVVKEFPRTSSGKISRNQLKNKLLAHA